MIVINSGLKGFVMLDWVHEVNATHIMGTRSFSNAPIYVGLESLAQLGAYHIRHLTDFSKHIFLIKIAHCRLPTGKIIDGEFLLSGNIIAQSESSYHCRLKAEKEKLAVIEGEFLFAAVPYTHNFKSDRLRHHYAKVFSCLLKDTKTA